MLQGENYPLYSEKAETALPEPVITSEQYTHLTSVPPTSLFANQVHFSLLGS